MQIYILFFSLSLLNTIRRGFFPVVIFSVWTLKASDAFDKYLKLTFNPAATFFYLHHQSTGGETFTMDEHSPAQMCSGCEAANRIDWILRSWFVPRQWFPLCAGQRPAQNPCGMCFITGDGNPGRKISQPCPACFDDHSLSFSTHGTTLAEA